MDKEFSERKDTEVMKCNIHPLEIPKTLKHNLKKTCLNIFRNGRTNFIKIHFSISSRDFFSGSNNFMPLWLVYCYAFLNKDVSGRVMQN